MCGPHEVARPSGLTVKVKGKWHRVDKQCYATSVANEDAQKLASKIGLSIPRKREGPTARREREIETKVGRGFEPL